MSYPIIKDWIVCTRSLDNPQARIQGIVFEHDKYLDGTEITTSYIDCKGPDPNTIETTSGSIYLLDNPRPSYVEWCKQKGCHIPSKEKPIKWKDDEDE